MSMRVWYCGRCRRVLKVEPKRAIPKGVSARSRCWPKISTLVHDDVLSTGLECQ